LLLHYEAVRRFLRKFTFFPTVLILAGFGAAIWWLAQPLEEAQSPPAVTGVVRAAPELRPDAPLVFSVGLNPGPTRPASEAPEFPLDDVQPDEGATFELVAEEGDGRQFWVIARVDTAKIERWCEVVDVPPLRRLEDGTWVEAETGRPLPPLDITVDRDTPC
jgi:hypothetical protein